MSRKDDAVRMFREGYSCSQSILAVYGKDHGLDEETALRMATTFSGGMGYSGGTCGAVTGALMVLGLELGTVKPGTNPEKVRSMKAAGEFIDTFARKRGSVLCPDLIDADLGTKEGRKKAVENNVFEEICPHLVGEAAEILESIIDR